MDILKRLSGFTDGMSNADVYKLAHDEIALLRAKLAQPTPSQSVELENILHNYADFVRDQIESAGMVDLDFAIKTVSAEINQLFKPQPTPSQSDDEYLFADWWHDHHIGFNHNDIVKACELAFNAGQAQSKLSKSQPTSQDADTIGLIASKSILKVITEHGIEIYEGRKSQLQAKIQCAVIEAINAAKDGK